MSFAHSANAMPNRVGPMPVTDAVPYYQLAATPPPVHASRATVAKQWLVALTCGIVSMMTCCCCCAGFCGNLKGPMVLYGDMELDDKNDVDATQCSHNASSWCKATTLSCICAPLCCGCCCGVCGTVTPHDASECIFGMYRRDYP